jgi:hypothetical protein
MNVMRLVMVFATAAALCAADGFGEILPPGGADRLPVAAQGVSLLADLQFSQVSQPGTYLGSQGNQVFVGIPVRLRDDKALGCGNAITAREVAGAERCFGYPQGQLAVTEIGTSRPAGQSCSLGRDKIDSLIVTSIPFDPAGTQMSATKIIAYKVKMDYPIGPSTFTPPPPYQTLRVIYQRWRNPDGSFAHRVHVSPNGMRQSACSL